MKILFQTLLALFITTQAFSKCRSQGFDFWPANKNIKGNSIFLIDGYEKSQAVIKELGKTHKIYLKSKDQKINLLVEEILIGEYHVTQALLKPEQKLIAGQTYTLVIENLKDADQLLSRYDETTNEYEPVKWTVEKDIDTTSPIWANNPIEKDKTYEPTACGPTVFVNFSFAVNESSEYLVKTTVKKISTNKVTTYYLQPKDNVIAIGHGMCTGGFELGSKNDFEASFTLVDASGNQTASVDKTIKFTSPKYNF